MGKEKKKSKSEGVSEADVSIAETDKESGRDGKSEKEVYQERLQACLPIARPLASRKLNKKILKTVKKAAGQKHLHRGVKEVVKCLRKSTPGSADSLVVIAGDISPMDVISHIPVLCEDMQVPYVFTPSKEELGQAGATKRPTSCVMIIPGGKKHNLQAAQEYMPLYNEVKKSVQSHDDMIEV